MRNEADLSEVMLAHRTVSYCVYLVLIIIVEFIDLLIFR